MNTTKMKYSLISLLALITSVSGCIEDNISPPLTGELDGVAEMIVYFESKGDFPNSDLAPALIDAEEIFTNLNSYLIIDIRAEEKFTEGHIEKAVNVAPDSLYRFVESKYPVGYPKIVIVSKNGQSSAYFTCLLRLAGFDNIYSLNYGMASWNLVFSEEWLANTGDAPGANFFINENFEKNPFAPLPKISFANPEESIEKRVNARIKLIISEGFIPNVIFTDILGLDSYLICYGKRILYNARKFGPFAERGHPDGAISYLDATFFDLRSVNYLQTLPNSEPILIYDYNGQLGACMTAYLRVLGYDVKFLLFGANRLFHSRMIFEIDLKAFAFTDALIKNYPYETGQ
jgi:rhodanese-related sulfurtransferase